VQLLGVEGPATSFCGGFCRRRAADGGHHQLDQEPHHPQARRSQIPRDRLRGSCRYQDRRDDLARQTFQENGIARRPTRLAGQVEESRFARPLCAASHRCRGHLQPLGQRLLRAGPDKLVIAQDGQGLQEFPFPFLEGETGDARRDVEIERELKLCRHDSDPSLPASTVAHPKGPLGGRSFDCQVLTPQNLNVAIGVNSEADVAASDAND
jgi:hypothetical protein